MTSELETTLAKELTVSQYEKMLKRLDNWQTRAHQWQSSRQSLSDKLEAAQLLRVLTEARRLLRGQYYRFEDMCSEQSKTEEARS